MPNFNSNFKCTYIHSSNTTLLHQSLHTCLKSNNTNTLSPLVASVFTRYGNRPPYPYTIFDSVYEACDSLPYNISSNAIHLDKIHHNDITFSIEKYLQALRNAIKTDRKNKVVFLSSGWDSTAILALLVDKYGPKDITCITLKMLYDANDTSKVFNPYEIEKARNFCEYYKVKHVIVNSEFWDKDINQVDRLAEMANASFYNATAFNHKTLWTAVEKLGYEASDTAVFAGEFSDGAHNWGFAQSFGAVHPEKGLREYADKARAYFMSPNYLNRVFAGDESLNNDSLSNWLLPGPVRKTESCTSERDFLADYLSDLFYEDVRGPYTPPSSNYIPENLLKTGKNLFRASIIDSNLPTSINQIYKAYIDIYHYTHWMGSTVHGLRHFAPDDYSLIIPFGDQYVLDLLRTMPTEYGRGLEIRPTKYPLKKILKEFIDYPVNLQDGQHAYVYDDDQSINLQESILSSGTELFEILYSHLRQNLNSSLSNTLPRLAESVCLYVRNPSNFEGAPPTNVTTAFLLMNYQLNLFSL